MNKKYTIKNITAYIIGNIRYSLYYSWFEWMMRPHISEQIEYRIRSMKKKCYDTGSCEMCGCATTALQMSNKACDKPCYPKMISLFYWKRLIKGSTIYCDDDAHNWKINIKERKFVKL